MHIVLVSRWYPPHTGYGGVAAYNHSLAHALRELGHHVSVVAARWSADVPAAADDRGVRVLRLLAPYHYRLHRLPLLGRQMRAIEQLRYSRKVARALAGLDARHPIDVVEFAEVNAEGFAYQRQRRRAPVVVRCHTPTFILQHYTTPDEAPYDVSAIIAMEKYSIRHADALTAPSHDMARTIARECGIAIEHIQVIPNAVDVHAFAPSGENATAKQAITMLHVGRIERVKGVEVLVRAIPVLAARAPMARVVFVGEGSMRAQLENWLRDQGLLERVIFTGGVDATALAQWYRQADIAVVPSLNYESFSYTCAQAMAAGLPVVATQLGGMPETIEGAGLLVPPGDADALAGALVRLCSDASLREQLGSAGRINAEQRFAANVTAQQTVDVYTTLIARLSPTAYIISH